MKHTSVDKSGIRSKGMTKSEKLKQKIEGENRQQLVDRVNMVIGNNSYSQNFPITVQDWVMGQIAIKPLYMFPSSMIREFGSEFYTCYLNDDGFLVIG